MGEGTTRELSYPFASARSSFGNYIRDNTNFDCGNGYTNGPGFLMNQHSLSHMRRRFCVSWPGWSSAHSLACPGALPRCTESASRDFIERIRDRESFFLSSLNPHRHSGFLLLYENRTNRTINRTRAAKEVWRDGTRRACAHGGVGEARA
jgi:hypothetical protein